MSTASFLRFDRSKSIASTFMEERNLITNQDENEEFVDREHDDLNPNDYINHGRWPKRLIVSSIYKAIENSNTAELAFLLKQLKRNRNSRTRSLNGSRLSKDRLQHTILIYAIIHKKSSCIQTILHGISRGYVPWTMIDHVCSNGRTALWYACSYGDLKLVQQLVEHFHAIVTQCGVLIVAAQNGHQDIVEYLLSQGANPNRNTKNYNERALHAAARRNHLGIVNILLKHGADPHITDRYRNRTALDYAIHKRHIDIAKVLIRHHAGRFFMDQNGFTPLMLAASCNNTTVVDIFSEILPRRQFLDELALLACNYTINSIPSKRDQAYVYFERALSMDTPSSSSYNSTPCEVYEFRSECQTLDELALIRKDDNAMRMHALLVSERLLLQRNEVDHFLSLLMKQSNIYKWHRLYHRCLQLRLYAYRIILQAEHNHRYNSLLYKKYLSTIVSILFKILLEEDTVPAESLVVVWTWILDRADNALTKFLFKFLFMTTYLIESSKLIDIERRPLLDQVRRTMHQKFTMPNKYLLLSYCIYLISTGLSHFTFASIRVSALSIIQLLIACGADLDEADPSTKSTPLHLLSSSESIDNGRFFIKLLLDANAHTDCVDRYGCLPEDCAAELEIKQLLQARRKLSLKCRCAQLIVSRNVFYVNCLSPRLIAFIRMHDKNSVDTAIKSSNCNATIGFQIGSYR